MFADLKPQIIKELNDQGNSNEYEPGEFIMFEGDDEAPVFFVLDGVVRIFKTNFDGREQTMVYLKKGEGFNIPTTYTHKHQSPASAIADMSTILFEIPQEDFRRISTQNQELALKVLTDLSTKLVHMTEMLHDISLRSVRERLSRFLLKQLSAEHQAHQNWTQEEIAMQIGTTREVVSRTLRDLIKEGIVRTERQNIIILDPIALENQIGS